MLRLSQNLECRQSLIHELGLRSPYYGSTLVRSEALLKKTFYQRGIQLIKSLAENEEYRSVLDLLHATLCPAWTPYIKAFYDGRGGRFIESVTWDIIDKTDQEMAHAIEELAYLYKTYCSYGWREGVEAEEFDQLTVAGLKMFIQPKMPLPSLPPITIDESEQESIAY